MDPLYLEDMTPGRTFDLPGEIAINADAIRAFAAQFDPQPFHLDDTAARSSPFGGLAASGWHTAALTMRLLVDGSPIAGGLIGVNVELSWPQPTRPGDRLRASCEVVESRASRSKPEQGIVKLRTTTRNQRDEPVQVMVSTMVVRVRGLSPADTRSG